MLQDADFVKGRFTSAKSATRSLSAKKRDRKYSSFAQQEEENPVTLEINRCKNVMNGVQPRFSRSSCA